MRVPSGSTSLANFNPSEFAKSVFAAVTARMTAFGREMYFMTMSLICLSMSLGWSPTGTCKGSADVENLRLVSLANSLLGGTHLGQTR